MSDNPPRREALPEQATERELDLPEEELRDLLGGRPEDDPAAYFPADRVDDLGDLTTSDQYLGEVEAGVNDDREEDPEDLELLTERELRADETDDAHEAAEEGMTYVPPIDPPTRPSASLEDAEVAAGFGVDALDEPYDADHQSTFDLGDDDMSERVRAALRADSSTSELVDRITIETRDGVVFLLGQVDDLLDSDNLVAVASYVEGVAEVIDRTELRGI
jgi:hypothetical protein